MPEGGKGGQTEWQLLALLRTSMEPDCIAGHGAWLVGQLGTIYFGLIQYVYIIVFPSI